MLHSFGLPDVIFHLTGWKEGSQPGRGLHIPLLMLKGADDAELAGAAAAAREIARTDTGPSQTNRICRL
eukprot:CAMPEP_0114549380 /NCGR_PEP_ID=MMETSP0114-20121206/5497_1 /TAXON_ID=31324 /ORGANISM="Goniomonas sp, Strain m" /LENGTH=68 /DNA_ID=CAMNT_0001734059 /DNA_START=44 /DNA_END=247 /DNA_ORIENTATION=-